MHSGILACIASAGVAVLVVATNADAGNPLVTVPRDYGATAAATYSAMSSADCLAELEQRGVSHLSTAAVPGVDAPVRLNGPLHGVTFSQVHRAPDEALNSDGGIVDCRLALALDDFAAILADRGIQSVGFISAYRKDTTGAVPAGQRHPSGLAIDIALFRHKDGTTWDVERDFHGRVGAKTCGRGAQHPGSRNALSLGLRRLVCDAGASRTFNLVLTPNYDTEHHNHVHFEVRRDIRWFLVQ